MLKSFLTLMVDGSQTLDKSLRTKSTIIKFSAFSLMEFFKYFLLFLSSCGLLPRLIVPLIGHEKIFLLRLFKNNSGLEEIIKLSLNLIKAE